MVKRLLQLNCHYLEIYITFRWVPLWFLLIDQFEIERRINRIENKSSFLRQYCRIRVNRINLGELLAVAVECSIREGILIPPVLILEAFSSIWQKIRLFDLQRCHDIKDVAITNLSSSKMCLATLLQDISYLFQFLCCRRLRFTAYVLRHRVVFCIGWNS